ncbi:hypothetical protein IO388_001546 [Campylobacter lari]|uniref:CDP-glycerol glycerophosphotransferase family protein n=1 Tax=Campylobacter lari TaxID=201 RepID=UPI0021F69DC9|nr:CDP-glycerol glycerophosphotransferase family protein [Campylobacter lari]EGK8096199.1 hypothetical protein [Campylobacter lari]MCW0187798.1 CDP-glycerol glycerophosphotransferase family protein [Campylobacter lari]
MERLDDKKNELLFKFYSSDCNGSNEIFINTQKLHVICFKIRQYIFFNKIFIFEKRYWVKSLKKDVGYFSAFLNKEKVDCIFEQKKIKNFNIIIMKMKFMKTKRMKNKPIWIFADMPFKADDNAEHLYRYILRNHPNQDIYFSLRKKSDDWNRLKQDGFKLVDPKTLRFKYLLFRSDKLISSHLDRYFFEGLGKKTLDTKDFIFLQHGITQNDISRWVNQRKIDLFISGTKEEFLSIAGDFNNYKFTTKEVKFTGFPRWDALIKGNKTDIKQILIMPTWRSYIVGTYSKKKMKRRLDYKKFYESEYFYKWSSFLHSRTFMVLCERYNYKILFHPHPQIKPYLKCFNLPNYVHTNNNFNIGIQKMFQESSIVITDYSSIAFDVKLLNKKILYYQFDKEDFFQKHFVNSGYFDYNKEIENIAYSQADLLKKLEIIFKNLSQNRMQKIEYNQDMYSKRVFNLILKE